MSMTEQEIKKRFFDYANRDMLEWREDLRSDLMESFQDMAQKVFKDKRIRVCIECSRLFITKHDDSHCSRICTELFEAWNEEEEAKERLQAAEAAKQGRDAAHFALVV